MAEERRVVTILFADVAGSTALGDALDPEDVRILLRRYYDVATETVAEYGGILEKFIGDAVVAVFGFPQTHDEDPQRAAVLEAQAERALGLADRDVERLGRAINLFKQAGALPYSARVRCERARVTGDDAEMKAGLELLERIGDVEQVGRFERLQVG